MINNKIARCKQGEWRGTRHSRGLSPRLDSLLHNFRARELKVL